MIKFLGYICVSKIYGLYIRAYSVVDNVVSPGGQDKGVCHFLRRRKKGMKYPCTQFHLMYIMPLDTHI